jgi:hypothetical protein
VRYLPNDPHQLTSHNRITSIGADTQVKAPFEFFALTDIEDPYHAPVKVYGHNFMSEQDTNGIDRKGFVEEPLIEKGTVDGIDGLFKNKEIQGRHKGGIRV